VIRKTAAIARRSARRSQCCHFWVIETAEGRTSRGQCILCGKQREFNNLLPDCFRDAICGSSDQSMEPQ